MVDIKIYTVIQQVLASENQCKRCSLQN